MGDSGCLIAFEGIEGAGKSTHLHAAATVLRQRGRDVVETREPGGTPLGLELRRLLMDRPDAPPTPLTELLLYLADRAQHVSEIIQPAVARGTVVLTDRFSASTIAYQGYARGMDLKTVMQLDAIARQGISPTMTLLLDCPVAIGLQRVRGNDRFHQEEHAFHERVRAGFLSLARQDADRYCVIDATRPNDCVRDEVVTAVLKCLQRT